LAMSWCARKHQRVKKSTGADLCLLNTVFNHSNCRLYKQQESRGCSIRQIC
jgi:hypothetical protein